MEKICENEYSRRHSIDVFNYAAARLTNYPLKTRWILLPLDSGLTRCKSDVIFFDPVLTSGGKRELVHSWNPFCRNSPHININAEVGHVRWQITEVENKESGEMFQGSRLTHPASSRLEWIYSTIPHPYHLLYFSFLLRSSSHPSLPHVSPARCFLRTRDKHWQSETGRRLLRIAINRSNLIKARERSISRRIRPNAKNAHPLSLSRWNLDESFFSFFFKYISCRR